MSKFFILVTSLLFLCNRWINHQHASLLFLFSFMLVFIEQLVNQSVGSKGFCRQKCHFSFTKKSKFCQKNPNFAFFRHSKIRLLQQSITVTAVNLIYEVLPKQFWGSFHFYFCLSKRAKIWPQIPNFLPDFHHLKLSASDIGRLQRILPLIMPFFIVKMCKCSQFCQMSSKIHIFVTTASFRHFVSFFVKNEILCSLSISHKVSAGYLRPTAHKAKQHIVSTSTNKKQH